MVMLSKELLEGIKNCRTITVKNPIKTVAKMLTDEEIHGSWVGAIAYDEMVCPIVPIVTFENALDQAKLAIDMQAKLDAVREYCKDQEINAISPPEYDFAVKILAMLNGDTNG
jgi:hypothetical protein